MHPDLPAPTGERSGVRELRLGVVLYGGASLAIYMHGTTKELQRLAKASALADQGLTGTTSTEPLRRPRSVALCSSFVWKRLIT